MPKLMCERLKNEWSNRFTSKHHSRNAKFSEVDGRTAFDEDGDTRFGEIQKDGSPEKIRLTLKNLS
jgi:hypothetical protein